MFFIECVSLQQPRALVLRLVCAKHLSTKWFFTARQTRGKGTDLYICIQDLGKIEECAPVTGAVLGAVPCLLSPSRLCPGSEVQECHGEQKEGVARFSLV